MGEVKLIEIEVTGAQGLTDAAKEAGNLNYQITQLQENNKALKKTASEAYGAGDEKYFKELSAQMADNNAKLKDLRSSYNNLLNQQKANKGSMDELKAATSAMVKEANSLNTSTTEGAKRFKELQESINGNREKIGEFEKSLGNSKDNVGKYTESIKEGFKDVAGQMGLVLGIAAAIGAAYEFLKDSNKAYMEADENEKKLLFAVNGRIQAQQELIELAEESQKTSVFGKEEVIKSEAFLATQKRSEEQIKKTIEAAKGLSTEMGTSLQSAVETLDGTMENGLIPRGISKLAGETKNLTQEQIKNGEAIDIVEQKYKGLAENTLTSAAGKIAKLKNDFEETKVSVGGFTSALETSLAPMLDKIATKATEFVNTMALVAKGVTNLGGAEDYREGYGSGQMHIRDKYKELTTGPKAISDAEFIKKLESAISHNQNKIDAMESGSGKSDLIGEVDAYQKFLDGLKVKRDDQAAADKLADENTIKALEQRIQKKQDEVDVDEISSTKKKQDEKDLKKLQDELTHAKGEQTAEEKKVTEEKQKQIDLQTKLNQQVLDSNSKAEADPGIALKLQLDASLSKVDDDYKSLKKTADNLEKINQIKKNLIEKYNNDILDIADKEIAEDTKKEAAGNGKQTKNLQEELDKQIDIIKKAAALKQLAVSMEQAKGAITDKEANKEKLKITSDALKQEIEIRKKAGVDATDLEQELTDQQIRDRQERKAKILEIEQQSADVINAIEESLAQIKHNQIDNEINDLQRKHDTQIAHIEDLHDKQQISDAEYTKEKKAADDEYNKRVSADKLKQWQADKKASEESIIIKTAEAAVVGFIRGGLLGAGEAAALGIAELAKVASTKPPVFGDGGIIGGPSHSQGGTLINAEGGEGVINKNSTGSNYDLLSAINRAGGGSTFNGADPVAAYRQAMALFPLPFAQRPPVYPPANLRQPYPEIDYTRMGAEVGSHIAASVNRIVPVVAVQEVSTIQSRNTQNVQITQSNA